jgi:hypothetical protein
MLILRLLTLANRLSQAAFPENLDMRDMLSIDPKIGLSPAVSFFFKFNTYPSLCTSSGLLDSFIPEVQKVALPGSLAEIADRPNVCAACHAGQLACPRHWFHP